MVGRGLLGVAFAFALYAFVAAPLSMRREDVTRNWVVARPELLASARRALVAVTIAVGGAALLLWYALFTRDFSIHYVALSVSRATQPWYTFSAFWSGMAGSLLLWCLILSIFTSVFAAPVGRKRGADREPFVPWAIPVLAGAELFYLAITTFAENPFARTDVIPVDGRGLNPLLQSPGMMIHPPMLYSGLVGLTVPFAIAVSALITKQTGADWIRVVRRWTLVPWLALGTGLVLGGAWAYTELGWGGYWGWDPVENAAFMPWLITTAFLHSAMVQERRGMLKVWNVFLVTTFASFATFGTFLTRSGLLSSVHTFAQSPVGKWFFVFLGVQTFVGLGLLVARLPQLRVAMSIDSAVSKEAAFLANNLVFVGAAAVVLWGTVLPLISEAITGDQLAVGPPFFNRVLAPIGAALLLLATVGTVTPWRRGSARRVARRLALPAAIASTIALAALVMTRRGSFAGLTFIGALLGSTSVVEIARAARARSRLANLPLLAAGRGLFARNPRRYGGYVVHLGVAIMVIGFAGSIGRAQTEITSAPGNHFSFAGYRFDYRKLVRFAVADKDVNLAELDVYRGDRKLVTMRPQLNFHRAWEQPQSEIAIRTTPKEDLYVILTSVGGPDGRSIFRIHRNPLVFWVWTGALIALIGGLTALLAGTRRVRRSVQAPAAELERV
jgi:cytochrome c-type biogenesis protein CcmF